jgi:CO/xanthine dehydrogenase FAD-binding subunit
VLRVDVLRPRTLEEALDLRARHPGAVPIHGGTDVMVELNFGRLDPPGFLLLDDVAELRATDRADGRVRLGAGTTYAELMRPPLAAALPALAEAARTVGSPQIRNRGTIGGNLGTCSPAGDALPPLVLLRAEVELASVNGRRTLPIAEYMLGPKRSALAPDELIVAVTLESRPVPQTFLKVGPRNAMVIAVVSVALAVDAERGELRAAYGSAGPVVGLVTAPLAEAASFPERVAAAASPIDDVRGTAAYRRHALRVLAARARDRLAA